MITLVLPPALKAEKGLLMQSPTPPIGVAYLAGSLKKAGYPYKVIDSVGEALDQIQRYDVRDDMFVQGLTFDQIVERIPVDTKYIGFSVMFSTLWPISSALLKKIRVRFPKTPIIAGGEHITAMPESVLSEGAADILVLGEGEFTLLRLLDALDKGQPLSQVDGIAFLDENRHFVRTSGVVRQKDLSQLARPDWEAVPLEAYISARQSQGVHRGRSMPVIATRGCPYKCTFCTNVNMYSARWIPRDPIDVVDELEYYMRRFKVTNFNFQDLTAFVKKKWIVDFTTEILKRGLKFTWQIPSGTRSEVFDEEVADLVYRAGLRNVSFAPESGDERVLAEVEKQVDLEAIEKAITIAVKRGIRTTAFTVIGFPGDTPDSLRNTARFLRKIALAGAHDAAVTKFQPYPGSPLFKQLQAEGKIVFDDNFFFGAMDFFRARAKSYCANIPAKRLYLWMIYLLLNFYIVSVATHPFRTVRICLKALFTGYEETRYAQFLYNVIFTRTQWLLKSLRFRKEAT